MNDARRGAIGRAFLSMGCRLLTAFLGVGCSSGGGGGVPGSPLQEGGAATAADAGDSGEGMTMAEAAGSAVAGGVCGFSSPVALGAAGADGMVEVPPNHPSIFYWGRVDCSNPRAPAFGFPGISIRVGFTGDAIDMRFKDHGQFGVQGTNYYDVILDGGDPTVVKVVPNQEIYPLGRNLGAGNHTIEIFKRVEASPAGKANAGKGEFLGFRIRSGMRVTAPRVRPRRVEFIGDSITCGYGNEVSIADPTMSPYTTRESNAYLAWGAVAARTLDAEYMAVAYSGRGVYRNFMGLAGDTLPQMYLKTIPDDAKAVAWSVTTAVPDVVVINLGTNDFSPGGVDRASYRAGYETFLTTLRGYYPTAPFVIAAGPMISDYYPAGEMAWTNIQADLQQIADDRKAGGDANVRVVLFAPQSAPYGEDYHPTVATHQKMADQVVGEIKMLMGW